MNSTDLNETGNIRIWRVHWVQRSVTTWRGSGIYRADTLEELQGDTRDEIRFRVEDYDSAPDSDWVEEKVLGEPEVERIEEVDPVVWVREMSHSLQSKLREVHELAEQAEALRQKGEDSDFLDEVCVLNSRVRDVI